MSAVGAVVEHVYPWVSEEACQEWVRRNRSAFEQLRAALASFHAPVAQWPDETLHARFLDAVFGLARGASGSSDVAALGTAVIRRQMALGASTVSLAVPEAPPWPSSEEWHASGAIAHADQPGTLRVWASPWLPSWMADRSHPPFLDVEAGLERRLSSELRPADPFFTAITGHQSYFSDGQRLAVRAVVASAHDATTLVVLPTGSGKTAVAHVAALLADRRGTALVIVPTVALALDQERAFRDLLKRTNRRLANEDFAYHSGLPEAERQALRERIRSGEQRMVFAAPESVERSLAYSLYEAADFGLITAFVIDEAHVVSEWGDEFRPEFQSVAGLRRGLLRAAARSQSGPFRTLLLTATPSQDAVETLRVGFSDDDRAFGVVAAPELRLEPTYWSHEFADEEGREAAVVEALRHLPRPVLLYTTKVDDSKRWAEILRGAGFRRVALVNGETAAERRRDALDGWRGVQVDGRTTRETRYDVVVATSAFGLGVDLEDVRAVVHACVPETIDRFYQEVGRGGRDGRACLSLVLHCRGDARVAKGINQTKLITRELAEARLQAMLAGAESLGGDRWRVDLAVLPSHTQHKRSYNLQWNQRTINLLARAHAVAWDGEKPELADSLLEDQADPEAWGAVIRLIRADHQSASFWSQVAETRSRRLAADAVSLARMFNALTPTAEVHRLLRDAYRVEVGGGTTLEPAESCGGCPWCREHHRQALVGGTAPLSTVMSTVALTGRLSALAAGRHAGIVLYQNGDAGWLSKVADAVRTAVSMGAFSLVVDSSARALDVTRLHRSSPCAAVFVEETGSVDLRDLPDVPTVYVAGPGASEFVTSDLVEGGYLLPRRRLIVADDETRDPSRTDRLLRDIHKWTPISRFLEAN